ncbi:hypothetical protein [Weissella sp. LMG 11983]|nr:hypothetical protein [Weissella sp. LMG 11983]MCW0927217.1 hypothetical protein [Weissella sp. LMG 11983]
MQLKLDQDGFIDEALVDDVRAGLSTAGTALGPINKDVEAQPSTV